MADVNAPLRIIVTGIIAQHPRLGGMTWHYLHYLLGLAQLGHDVYYLEDSGLLPYDLTEKIPADEGLAINREANIRHLSGVLDRYGMAGRWAYRCAPEARWFGLPDRQREKIVETADVLINVSGTLEEPALYRSIPKLAYIDTDPVVTQIKYLTGRPEFAPRIDAHDLHFSFGEAPSPLVPDTGHRWLPTRQPIFLSEWTPGAESRKAFTTVMNWTSYKPLRYRGREYAQKDAEFQRFVELPSKVAPVPLEVAMAPSQHPKWRSRLDDLPSHARDSVRERSQWTPQELLTSTGWQVVDANRCCGDLDSYRNYIRTSRAEWSVAKNAYVDGRPGWFSERSACYLAAGRPVVVQETGFSDVLPVGEGLLAFSNPAEAAAAIREVESDYTRHSLAARAIAEAHFDSDKVLASLLERILASEPGGPA